MHPQCQGTKMKMTLVQKLMLSAALLGNEASINVEQLYTVPNLQTLGVPLSMAFLTGIIAGPTAAVVLPVLGWISDKGSNPHKRKGFIILVATAVLFCGLSVVILANVLKILKIRSPNNLQSVNDTNQNQSFTDIHSSAQNSMQVLSFTSKSFASTETIYFSNAALNSTTYVPLHYQTSSDNQTANDDRAIESDGLLPVEAILGLLGYIMMDIGYDLTNSYVKAWTVASSERSQHTSLLLLGLLVAASGGMLSSCLGVLDITGIVGLSATTIPSVSVQTSVQCGIVIVLVTVGTWCTLLTGYRQYRSMQQNIDTRQPVDDKDDRCPLGTSLGLAAVPRYDLPANGQNCPVLEATFHADSSEKEPLLAKHKGAIDSTRTASVKMLDGSGNTEVKNSRILRPTDTQDAFTSNDQRSFVKNIICICGSVLFSTGIVYMYSIMSSDYVSKTIYGGDPKAVVGSIRFQNYQAGLHATSSGFIVYYSSYVLACLTNTRLLALIGYKVEFIAATLLMAGLFVVLAVVQRIEVFYALSAAAGIHRAFVYVIPFAVANDLIQVKAKRRHQTTAADVGLVMSLVTSSIPLAYTFLYPWIGLVEQMSGLVSLPLWLGAAYGTCSAFFFAFVGKV